MTIEVMDRITSRVASILPITWDAMSGDKRVDDSVLLDPISYAEAYYLGEEPDKATQDSMNRLVVEFIAKNAAVVLIDPAIDYWMEKSQTVVTTGTNETASFPDRIRALEKLKESLLREIAKLEPIVSPLIPIIRTRKGSSAPRMSTINDPLLTPNPQDFGEPYGPKIGAA
jgi:hypothetical protein